MTKRRTDSGSDRKNRRERLVVPELLDSLPPGDPAAQRSRRDLVRINALMGNLRWVRRSLARQAQALPRGARVIEVGAGDGRLATALAADGWSVIAIDRMPRPETCSPAVQWLQADVADALEGVAGEVVVASLFWHHFSEAALARMGSALGQFRGVVAAEPWRTRHAPWMGAALVPWVNAVTRHDMFVSIRAGFRHGELARAWGMRSADWAIEETGTARGAYRFQAWKRD